MKMLAWYLKLGHIGL